MDGINDTFHLLAASPLICRERLEFKPPVRIHPHAHHLIIYLQVEDGIAIVRVLHERMDIPTQLGTE